MKIQMIMIMMNYEMNNEDDNTHNRNERITLETQDRKLSSLSGTSELYPSESSSVLPRRFFLTANCGGQTLYQFTPPLKSRTRARTLPGLKLPTRLSDSHNRAKTAMMTWPSSKFVPSKTRKRVFHNAPSFHINSWGLYYDDGSNKSLNNNRRGRPPHSRAPIGNGAN